MTPYPVLSELHRGGDGRLWWGRFRLCCWYISPQSFLTAGFHFLGYWLAEILSYIRHGPGSFSLCLRVNQYYQERTMNQKVLLFEAEVLGPCPALCATFPLLDCHVSLSQWGLVYLTHVFPASWGKKMYAKYPFIHIRKVFLWVFLLKFLFTGVSYTRNKKVEVFRSQNSVSYSSYPAHAMFPTFSAA